MIKFRAWDKDEHEYFIDGSAGTLFNLVCCDDLSMMIPDNYIWEQFTGLKDVNGKEIYVGDIIQYNEHYYAYSMGGVTNIKTEYIGIVVKNNWSLGILINKVIHTDAHINHYNTKEFVPFRDFDDPEADVLLKGNVHANPELLEEDE